MRQDFDDANPVDAEDMELPNVHLRRELAAALTVEIKGWKLTQERAGQRLGVHRVVLNRLLNGKVERMSLDSLLNLSVAAGIPVEVTIGPSPSL